MKQKVSLTGIVVRNALFQGLSGLISRLGGLIFTITIARMLFPQHFGLYSLALSIVLVLATVTDLGIGHTLTRYLAESLGKKRLTEARSRFFFLLKFRLVIALVTSIALFLFASSLAALFKKPDLVLPLQIGSLYLFITALYGIVSPLFLTLQKVQYGTIAEAIFQASRIGLVVLFFYFYRVEAASVFIVLAAACLLALLFTFVIINRKFAFLLKGKQEPIERKRLLTFSGLVALSLLGAIIFTQIDRLMLGYFVPSEFIGFYAAIVSLVNGVFGLISFGIVLFPVLTQLKEARLERAFKKAFRYLALIAVPAAIGLAYIFVPALQLIYGHAYAPLQHRFAIVFTSAILSFIVLESVLSSLYVMLFNAKERPKFPALSMLAAAALNIVLNLIFILYLVKIGPEYCLIGVAAATLISRYANFGMLAVLSKHKLKISPDKSSILKPIAASLVMLAFLFIYDHFIDLNVATGTIMIILAALIYFGVMLLIKGIKKEDLRIFKLIKE